MSSTVQPWLRRAVLRLVQQQLADGSDVADLEILPGGPVQVVKFLSFADEHDPEKADDIWAQVSDPEHTALVLFDRTAVQRHQKARQHAGTREWAVTKLRGALFSITDIQPRLEVPPRAVCRAAALQPGKPTLVLFVLTFRPLGSRAEPPFFPHASCLWGRTQADSLRHSARQSSHHSFQQQHRPVHFQLSSSQQNLRQRQQQQQQQPRLSLAVPASLDADDGSDDAREEEARNGLGGRASRKDRAHEAVEIVELYEKGESADAWNGLTLDEISALANTQSQPQQQTRHIQQQRPVATPHAAEEPTTAPTTPMPMLAPLPVLVWEPPRPEKEKAGSSSPAADVSERAAGPPQDAPGPAQARAAAAGSEQQPPTNKKRKSAKAEAEQYPAAAEGRERASKKRRNGADNGDNDNGSRDVRRKTKDLS